MPQVCAFDAYFVTQMGVRIALEHSEYAIEMHGIHKWFGGTHALQGIDFQVPRGTCHALVGENGAGKSTLMKILGGIIKKDEGTILLNGQEVNIKSRNHSQELGIAFVPQELVFIPYFSVAENIYLGKEPKRSLGLIDWPRMRREAKALLENLHIDLPVMKRAERLGVSDQQMMVLAQILSENAEIIIMDEPTARLGHEEIKHLLGYIQYLKTQGKTIIYISHRLEEIFQVCDHVTVLRNGATVATKPISEVDNASLVRMMVNRDVNEIPSLDTGHQIGEVVLDVRDLSKQGVYSDVHFDVHQGEVIGFFGLVGSGRTEMIRGMLGVDKRDSCQVTLSGEAHSFKSIGQALDAGIVLVPEERRKQGVILSLPINQNITLGNLRSFSTKLGLLQHARERAAAKSAAEKLGVKCGSISDPVGSLSGGNQQKVVLAKYIDRDVKVFILDEPTRGIDIGAKDQIYHIIEDIARKNTAVIVISSEIPELQRLCDRIFVMKEGKITAELARKEFIQSESVLKHAIGV